MAINDFLPAAAELFGTLQSVAGYGYGSSAARRTGERTQEAAEFEALQLEQNAGQSIAASQRAAMEERRQAALVQSRILAVAAASGGGALDPTVVRLISQQAGEGEYRARAAMYQGEERARAQTMAAAAKRFEGTRARESGEQRGAAYEISAVGSLFKGTSTLYSRYAKDLVRPGWQAGDGWY